MFWKRSARPAATRNGGIIGLIGISRDITERKKKEEDILFLTYHDVSTGLYNSNYLDLVRSAYSQSSSPAPLRHHVRSERP